MHVAIAPSQRLPPRGHASTSDANLGEAVFAFVVYAYCLLRCVFGSESGYGGSLLLVVLSAALVVGSTVYSLGNPCASGVVVPLPLRHCDDPLGLPAGVTLLCAGALVFNNPLLLAAATFPLLTVAFSARVSSLPPSLCGVGIAIVVVSICFLAPAFTFSATLAISSSTAQAALAALTPLAALAAIIACPRSFTTAEAAATAAATTTTLANALRDYYALQSPTTSQPNWLDQHWQTVHAGLAACAAIWLCCVLPAAYFSSSPSHHSHYNSDMRPASKHAPNNTVATAVLALFATIVAATYVYVWVVVLGREPLQWIVNTYLLSPGSPPPEAGTAIWTWTRMWTPTMTLLSLWAALVLTTFVLLPPSKLHSKLPFHLSPKGRRILTRKAYHAVCLAVFLPPFFHHEHARTQALLQLAIIPALAALLLLQLLPAGRLREFAASVTDTRDDGAVLTTHLALFLGCAAPSLSGVPAVAVSGIMSVCVQDAVAAIVGAAVGRRPFGRGARTFEGFSAAATITVAALLLAFAALAAGTPTTAPVVTATVLTGVIEAFTDQVDNWVVPMTMCTALGAW